MSFEIISNNLNIDFVRLRRYAYVLSAILLLIGVVSLATKGGPRYGVDFAGGCNVQIKFSQKTDLAQIREALEGTTLPGVIVQNFGDADENTVLVRAAVSEHSANAIREAINQSLQSKIPGTNYELQRLEMVGPKVGADLREKALQAIFYAVLLIATYISGRFEQKWVVAGLMAGALATVVYALEWLHAPMSLSVIAATIATLVLCVVLRLKFALGAMVALIHDVMIPLGIFSLLNKEIDLTIIAALLTIVGYSLNDTIIIYDRIRENIRAHRTHTLDEIINNSVNQTLSRTILTSGSTFIAVFSLYIFGGAVIQDFALTMIIGIIAGTYSSIFVAAPVLRVFNINLDEDEPQAPAVEVEA